MMYALVGFFSGGVHLVPDDVRPYSWDHHRPTLTEADIAYLAATTDGYYFGLCGLVCVRPLEGMDRWHRRALCTACATKAHQYHRPPRSG